MASLFDFISFLERAYQFLKTGEMNKDMSGKLEKCIDIVDGILERDEKTLIFTQYKEMGDILVNVISQECNTEPLFFHGSLTVAQREEMIDKLYDFVQS